MFEVWSVYRLERFDGKEFPEEVFESRRTDRKDAEQDVALLKVVTGRTAWIVEGIKS